MTPLPRLTTVGNALVARSADGLRPVRLKGLNRSGLQHKPTLELAGLNAPRTELGAWRRQWGATVIRLPMAVDYYMEKDGYQAAIDEVVAAAAEEDLYLILELHGTSALLNEPLPTAGADRAWAELARRYGAMPHVVFDLWNEPHDVSWEDWRKAAIGLIETIRYAGAAESLVLVAGLEWAYDLSPLLLLKNQFPNLGPLAYATHPYPWKGDPPHGPAQWEQKFGRVARDLFGAGLKVIHLAPE